MPIVVRIVLEGMCTLVKFISLELDYLDEMARRSANKKYQSFYSIDEMEAKINFDNSLTDKRDIEIYVLESTGEVYIRVNKPVTQGSSLKIQEIKEHFLNRSFCSPETLDFIWHAITHVLKEQDMYGDW